MSKKGFTLAEILITLTVIGVVAALTIPTLLQNTNQAEFKTALKRDFADLSQATLLIKNDAGGSLVNAFPGDNLGSESLKNAYKGKLSYIKECSGNAGNGGSGTGVSAEGCWHSNGAWKELNGNTIFAIGCPGLVLSNGTLIYYNNLSSACSAQVSDYMSCGFMELDVNGFKKPNVKGKDIFSVFLTDQGLIPFGARGFLDPSGDCNLSNTMGTNTGSGCTALYLYQ